MSNPGTIPATLTSLVITAAGSANDQTGISSVQVYVDTNGNGVVDAGESLLGSGAYNADNGTATITINNVVPAGTNENLLVVDNFSSSAGNGTYQAMINAGGISGTSANGNVNITGLPVMGAVVSVLHPTPVPTDTPTTTSTPTPTPTASFTPTPPILAVVLGSNKPTDSTQQPGATNIAVLQIQVTNSSAVPATLTNLVLTASGSGNDNTGITSVLVYVDANGNGVLDTGDTLLGSPVSYSADNGTITYALNTTVPAGTSVDYLVMDNFTSTASDGTYQASIKAGAISGTSANGNIQFTGLPVSGAVVTIAHLIPTPTATPTPTFTATPVPSLTPTATFTVTATHRPSTGTVVVYPNPADGTQPVSIYIPGRTGTSDITVQIFTVAFRLVQQQLFQKVPAGVDVSFELKDRWGHSLASGLYYVVMTIDGKRTILKLLIIR